MYESYFGLSKKPFLMTPDPGALYLTPAHQEGLAGLAYAGLQCLGFVVLLGEAGTGKTTLLKRFLEIPPAKDARTALIVNPTLTPPEFIEHVLIKFGVPSVPQGKARQLFVLEQLIMEANQAGKPCILVIDEAHKLGFEVLEEIRLLTNFETNERKLLQIVLAGQPELAAVLRRPELWQLQQRVDLRLKIEPLSLEQVDQYLTYRWVRAGGRSHPFSEEAVLVLSKYSRGIPRIINAISDGALLLAFSKTMRTVGSSQILETVRELDLLLRAPFAEPAPAGFAAAPPAAMLDLPAPGVSSRPAETTGLRTIDNLIPRRTKSILWWRRRAEVRA